MKGDDSNSSSGTDMDVDSSESEDTKPTRSQRNASVASRAGIKKSLRQDSESEQESEYSDEDGSNGSSSGGSDSFVDEDEDESDSGKKRKRVSATTKRAVAKPKKVIKKPAKKASPAKKTTSAKSSGKSTPAKSEKSAKPAKRGKKDSDDEDEDEGSDNDQSMFAQRVMRTVDRSPKEQLVADLLCRWWYVLPDWPPAEFDYAPRLAKENLRIVNLDKWEDEPDLDSQGRLKCYTLSQYKGLYRDAKQQLRDLRPIEGKPSFNEFVKKSEKELVTLLVQAINKQIEILSNSNERNTEPLIAELKDKLKVYTKRK